MQERSDYVVDTCAHYQHGFPTYFGEIKAAKTTDYYPFSTSMYTLAPFSQSAIQEYKLDGIFAFQTIGKIRLLSNLEYAN